MFRVLVTYCVVATTAAGPWLCCCALASTGDAVALLRSSSGHARGHRGCCGHTHGPGRNLPPGREAPGPVAPGECPCKAFAPGYAAVVPPRTEPADPVGDDLAGLGSAWAYDARHGVLVAAGRKLSTGPLSPHPGTARDLLAVLQTLRC